MKYQFLALFLFFLFICCNKNGTSNQKEISFFDEIVYGSSGSQQRIFINSGFDECGEWGGHKEEMEIYAESDKNFYLDYKKYEVNCDEVGKLYGKPEFQNLVASQTLQLDAEKKAAILNYITQLTRAKITEFRRGN